jgi:hypothetical protein
MQARLSRVQEATIENVENYLGWTLTSSEFMRAIHQHSPGSAHV